MPVRSRSLSEKCVKVKFKSYQGECYEIDATVGLSLMKSATSQALAGIVAECGGALSCATCHVHVDEEWFDKLPAAKQSELTMLEFAAEPHPRGRLSCQIKITEALDGLSVLIPDSQ
ncbi:MAG: 2Fe-2S iron-sulfur cluster binding domain-containing protein [Pseudomonadales bacterium]|nr:2Fe-2S iron-sulfur cluster binding domain-containing protein [Pseudomonadales bacterium]